MLNGIKSRALGYTRALFELRARRKIESHAVLWKELQQYMQRSGSTGCNYLDYWELYTNVRARRPREILECGTGVSTVVLAVALQENEAETGVRGRVTSMEEEPKYFEQAKSLFPAAYSGYAELLQSERAEDQFGLFRGMRYRDVPDRPYDFVFVDGPNYIAPSDGGVTFDFDLLHVLRRAEHKVFGIVDKRVTTGYVLQRLLGPKLARYDARKHLCFVGPASRADLRSIDPKRASEAFRDSFRLLGGSNLEL
jgi:predicted O-methyltransferase YrrM